MNDEFSNIQPLYTSPHLTHHLNTRTRYNQSSFNTRGNSLPSPSSLKANIDFGRLLEENEAKCSILTNSIIDDKEANEIKNEFSFINASIIKRKNNTTNKLLSKRPTDNRLNKDENNNFLMDLGVLKVGLKTLNTNIDDIISPPNINLNDYIDPSHKNNSKLNKRKLNDLASLVDDNYGLNLNFDLNTINKIKQNKKPNEIIDNFNRTPVSLEASTTRFKGSLILDESYIAQSNPVQTFNTSPSSILMPVTSKSPILNSNSTKQLVGLNKFKF